MKVKFLPSEKEYEIEFNETVLHLAQRCGLYIQSVCKGIPSCAECRVQLVEGEHHVLPPSKKELNLIGTAHYVDLSRLSCQLRCFGDVIIDLSEQIEKEKKVQRKTEDIAFRKDGQKSKAILGSILSDVIPDDPETSKKEFNKEVRKKEKIKTTFSHGKKSCLDKRDAFYGNFYTDGNKKKSNSSNNKKRNKKRISKKKNLSSSGKRQKR